MNKAREYFEKAHAIGLKEYGPDFPNTKNAKAALDALNEELKKE